MRLALTGRNVEITPTLRRLVDRRLAPLQRQLNDSIVSAQVVLTREKHRHLSDVTVHMRGDHVLAGKCSGADWSEAITAAFEKVGHQATKVKGKWGERKRRALPARRLPAPVPAVPADTVAAPRIVRAARYHVKPMSVEDAALAIEAGADGFLVFRNAGTGAINVLYRRKTGDLALIEPER